MDEQYTYHAFRYIENNPVRAKMVAKAIDYKYSSARYHCGLASDYWVSEYDFGISQEEYEQYLEQTNDQENIDILRCNTNKGLPCGSDGFVASLSESIGKNLSFVGRGRPRKKP